MAKRRRKVQDDQQLLVKRGEQWAFRSESGGHESHVKIMGVRKPTAFVLQGGGAITSAPSVTFREVTRSGANKGKILQDRTSQGKVKKSTGYTHVLRLMDGAWTMGPGWRKVN